MGSLAMGLIMLAVIILLFLLGREVICWYWKINEGIALLKDIKELLIEQNEKTARPKSGPWRV